LDIDQRLQVYLEVDEQDVLVGCSYDDTPQVADNRLVASPKAFVGKDGSLARSLDDLRPLRYDLTASVTFLPVVAAVDAVAATCRLRL
jgi:hypothetical protein